MVILAVYLPKRLLTITTGIDGTKYLFKSAVINKSESIFPGLECTFSSKRQNWSFLLMEFLTREVD